MTISLPRVKARIMEIFFALQRAVDVVPEEEVQAILRAVEELYALATRNVSATARHVARLVHPDEVHETGAIAAIHERMMCARDCWDTGLDTAHKGGSTFRLPRSMHLAAYFAANHPISYDASHDQANHIFLPWFARLLESQFAPMLAASKSVEARRDLLRAWMSILWGAQKVAEQFDGYAFVATLPSTELVTSASEVWYFDAALYSSVYTREFGAVVRPTAVTRPLLKREGKTVQRGAFI